MNKTQKILAIVFSILFIILVSELIFYFINHYSPSKTKKPPSQVENTNVSESSLNNQAKQPNLELSDSVKHTLEMAAPRGILTNATTNIILEGKIINLTKSEEKTSITLQNTATSDTFTFSLKQDEMTEALVIPNAENQVKPLPALEALHTDMLVKVKITLDLLDTSNKARLISIETKN